MTKRHPEIMKIVSKVFSYQVNYRQSIQNQTRSFSKLFRMI